ncbi:MAG: FAD-dependent oxidoreductase [Myxococcota bacterium]|nr:FAD-dependent oxidoreductase [Myxococcota bacterium]
MTSLPTQARCVVIGGGIIGSSVAYHLTKLGWTDTLVVERGQLTCGSTFHAAGLVGQLRSSANITQLLKYSVELYDNLEEDTGQATGWKQNGGLRLACNADRWIELKRQATTARSFGLPVELLSPSEAQALWPLMDASDLVGAAVLPTDGQANPSDVTMALAKGARQRGVRIVENCAVTGIETHEGRVSAVLTEQGRIACEVVVNCAGQWARELGAMVGVAVPVCSVEHQYMITEEIPGITRDLPTLRDPDRLIYFKEEVGGLVMGGYEANPIAWAKQGIPRGFIFSLLSSNFEHFEGLMEQALIRVPALADAGVRQLINGPEAFTPDGSFILGEAPSLKGFYVGAGFNAYGIAAAGGAGRALAEWIVAGEPTMDLWPVDIRRFHEHHGDIEWVRERTLELYAKHYTMSWPLEEHDSARPRRVSPLYSRLQAAGACFGEKLGWERPNWFAPPGTKPVDRYSFSEPNWEQAVRREHLACRESVAIFDQSSFAKFEMSGADAEQALSWICANDVTAPPGKLVYTQMLNRRGGIECDLTVARLAQDRFYLVTGTGFSTHDFHWIRSNIPAGLDAHLSDVTGDYAVLALMGPKARQVLSAICDDDLSNEAFGFAQQREIGVTDFSVRALRLTYVGELGWELHVPTAQAGKLYDLLMQAGAAFGIVNAGYRAIETLRLEKGYRAWPGEVGPDHTPLEAGLSWAVKLKTEQAFVGREALEKQRVNGLNKKLACFVIDDPKQRLWGRETILRNGEPVGWLSSAGFAHSAGVWIGYGYVRQPDIKVDRAFLEAGSYELEIATESVPARLVFGALIDPLGLRVRS